jgi:hypothetical protein
MPENPPLVAAGTRAPQKRPQPIPRPVREAIKLTVYGRIDDPDCAPVDFIEAAKSVSMKPDQMRRWLDRPNVRALLLAERRTFRDAICAGNEGALRRIRDERPNAMAQVHAIKTLEQLGEEAAARPNSAAQTPGVVIRVLNVTTPPAEPRTINVTPEPVRTP